MGIKITFERMKYAAGYNIVADGQYAGTVLREGRLWSVQPTGGVPSEAIFATRKGAVEAIMPFIRVEALARQHWLNATSEDPTISAGDSPTYMTSRAALLYAISYMYSDFDAKDIYHAWTEHGETVLQTVRAMRVEREAWAAHEAELAAEEEAYRAQTQAPESFEAPEERDVTIDISSDGMSGYTLTLVTVFPEATVPDGFTRAGTPFARIAVPYTDLAAARQMADVMAAEFRNDTSKVWAAYTVTLTGLASLSSRLSPEVRVREGGSFRAAVIASAPPVAAKVPTYRTAGFPSLDAAIGASYASR